MAKRKRFDVRWTAPAASDLEAILEYIARGDPVGALRVLHRVERLASGLEMLPRRGRLVPELLDHGIGLYRELILSPWRLVYRISEKTVWVLAFLDSRRNVEDLLLDRFLRGSETD